MINLLEENKDMYSIFLEYKVGIHQVRLAGFILIIFFILLY